MSNDLATALGRTFITRKDVKAIQKHDGSYQPHGRYNAKGEREELFKWTMKDLNDHIAGTQTFGHYVVGTDGTCKFFAFDIDLRKAGKIINAPEDVLVGGFREIAPRDAWRSRNAPDANAQDIEFLTIALRCMAEGLGQKIIKLYDIPVIISYSGSKGLHVYGLTGSVPAEEAKRGAIEVLKAFGCFEPTKGENFWQHTSQDGHYANLDIEIFPKQDNLEGKDFGNLMRLPLGVHRTTGEKSFFLDCRCGYNQLKAIDPMTALSGDFIPWG